MRGTYSNCDPMTVRYSYLNAKVRDQAMVCTLPPSSLPLLVPPTSALAAKPASNTSLSESPLARRHGVTAMCRRSRRCRVKKSLNLLVPRSK